MHQKRILKRNTIGQNTRVFIGKDIAYSAAATFQAFVEEANVDPVANDGEVGVFKLTSAMNSDSEATIQTAALVAGESFFIAQVQTQVDGEVLIKKTPVYKFEDISDKRREAFCLPVLQVSHVGYNGVDGALEDVVPAVLPGDIFAISVMETTEGYQPLPTWNWEYTAKAGDDLEAVVDAIVLDINTLTPRVDEDNPPVVTAAKVGAPGNLGIEITANETQLSFAVTVKEGFRDALIRLTTPFKYGSGFREDVRYIEREGQIFDGTTTVNAMYRDEHGRQVDYAKFALAYDYFHLDFLKRFESKGYKHSEETQESQVLVAAPIETAPGGDYTAAGASPIDELALIFGL
jgi:hypothetical protein